MKRVPFNVSARTARLIGRENLSSAEGAIIELVKNSYDADASFCIVYFDDLYSELPKTANAETISHICELTGESAISLCYKADLFNELIFSETEYNKRFNKKEQASIQKSMSESVTLHIFDDGDGMTQSIIEDTWMTIGTDNKFLNFKSSTSGRIKSGAKGIGRFALDRLADQCRLLTKTVNSESTLAWAVKWNDFDQHGVTIDEVKAELGDSEITLATSIEHLLGEKISDLPAHYGAKGTHIKMSPARDIWNKVYIEQIFRELESLAPPSEAGDFSIYVFSKANPKDFGKVNSAICDDYDYKIHAAMDDSGQITFEIHRNEINPEKITPELLEYDYFHDHKITKEQLCNQSVTYTKALSDLLPGITDQNEQIHKTIGPFELTLYFLKKGSDKDDVETFLHRKYDSTERRKWLDHNSGIRIYRDNFRVRPYGEIGKSSWDWLGLGNRAAEDPSALRSGRWRVTPGNVSGVVNISRTQNLELEDKSSREGMRENDAFILFKRIIEAIVKEFEADRSGIYKDIYRYSQSHKNIPGEEYLTSLQEVDAEILAQKIFKEIKSSNTQDIIDQSGKLAIALLKANARTREIDDQLEEMKRENSLLRVFASSGLTIASFTHELDGLNAKLGGRFDKLEELFMDFLSLDNFQRAQIPAYKDPFKRIKTLQRDDEKLKNWIKYSLRTIRKDKRNRNKIMIKSYLENLREEWNSTLIDRQIELSVSTCSEELSLKAYEIDLDCIFNNLIINSTEAFKRSGFSGARKINIYALETTNGLAFKYSDSGPGLSVDIKNPDDIFTATFTTKIDKQGTQTGTGLGMWLVQKTLEEYKGKASIIPSDGFAIDMEVTL